MRSSDKEICPSYLTHVGEGGSQQRKLVCFNEISSRTPRAEDKEMENYPWFTKSARLKEQNSLLDFLGLGGSRIFNRGTGSNLLPITLYEVRYLPIIPWNTMEYFKNHFCASVAFSSVVI